MKPRMFLMFLAVALISVSMVFAQSKENCTAKSASAQKSCCMHGAKTAVLSSNKATDEAGQSKTNCGGVKEARTSEENSDAAVKIVTVKNDNSNGNKSSGCAAMAKDASHCTAKTASMAKECTPEEKAHCEEMMKSGKVSMSGSGCCKNKAKSLEAKNTDVKAKPAKTVAEGKGTN